MGQSCVSAKAQGDDDTVDMKALDADLARRKLNPLSHTTMETTKVPSKRGDQQQQQAQNRAERSFGSKEQSEHMIMSSMVPRSSSSTATASRTPSADHHNCQQQVLLKRSGGSSRRIAPSLPSPLLLAFPKQKSDDNEDDKDELGGVVTAPFVSVGASSSLRPEVASVATALDLDPCTIPTNEEGEDSTKQKHHRRARHHLPRGINSGDVASADVNAEESGDDSSDDAAEMLRMQSRSGMVITSMRSELLWRAAAASGIVASTTSTITNPLNASSLGSLSVNGGSKGKSPLSSTLTSHGGSSRAGWSFSKMHMSGSTGAPPSYRKSLSFSRSGGGSTAPDGMTAGTTTSFSTAMATPDPSSLKVPEVVTSTTVVRFNDMATVFVGDDVLASSHTSRQQQQQQMHHEPKDDMLASITRCDSESGEDEEEKGGLEDDEWVMIPTSQLLRVIPSTTPTATGGCGTGDDACHPSNASVFAMTGTTCSSSPTTTYATRSTAESPQFAATVGGGIQQQRLVVQSSHRAGLAQPTRQCADFAVWQGSSSNSDVDDDNDDETPAH
jgi:hypothetical protein